MWSGFLLMVLGGGWAMFVLEVQRIREERQNCEIRITIRGGDTA